MSYNQKARLKYYYKNQERFKEIEREKKREKRLIQIGEIVREYKNDLYKYLTRKMK